MEKKLRSHLKYSNAEVNNYCERMKQIFSSFDNEQDQLNKLKITKDSINKTISYSNKNKNKIIEEKIEEFSKFKEEIISIENDFTIKKEELGNLIEENFKIKEQVEKMRMQKIEYFNKINKLRKENNNNNQILIEKLKSTNKEAKTLFKEFCLLLNFLKTRILNTSEICNKQEKHAVGYFLDLHSGNFKLFNIDISSESPEDKFKRLKLFWEGLYDSIIIK